MLTESLTYGSPSHNEIPIYVFGMPPNILGDPLRGTEPTLLPTWQQTYAPSTPYNAVAAHTPSHFTFHSTVFQCFRLVSFGADMLDVISSAACYS